MNRFAGREQIENEPKKKRGEAEHDRGTKNWMKQSRRKREFLNKKKIRGERNRQKKDECQNENKWERRSRLSQMVTHKYTNTHAHSDPSNRADIWPRVDYG